MTQEAETLQELADQKYKYGFVSDIESEFAPKGLNEDIVRFISAKKNEPEWMLEWRLDAYRRWIKMEEPTWARVNYPKIDFQDFYYYAAPKGDSEKPKSLDEIDPELLRTYEKLGIPLSEQKMLSGVAVDAVFDSVSVATTFKATLEEAGVIFCPISEALQKHPDLVRKYLGSVVPPTDNYYATLNCAVFSDGSFVYVPEGVRCPMELSTYFRINASKTGQFERTLIIVDKGAYVSYLEGCTAPQRDENQLHAAVVELVALEGAEIKYSTVQNWYPGDENGKGGIYNFVTKRGDCRGANSKISWTQVETGSAVTWKYPSCILRGENSVGEFYSIAITNNYQQADTGTKMIHLGKNTKSRIVSKGISAGYAQNTYRGLVSVNSKADGARNFTQCDSCSSVRSVARIRSPTSFRATRRPFSNTRRRPQRSATTSSSIASRAASPPSRRWRSSSTDFAARSCNNCRWNSPSRRKNSSASVSKGASDNARNQGSLHANINGKDILKGVKLNIPAGEVHALMGPNGAGKSTTSYTLAGREGYNVTSGSVTLDNEDILPLSPEERAAKGIFLAFQYPLEIPGVSTLNFLKTALNAQRQARRAGTRRRAIPEARARNGEEAQCHGRDAEAPAQRRLFRRREEAQRDFTDGAAQAEACHSG